jgi:hypothetical protein
MPFSIPHIKINCYTVLGKAKVIWFLEGLKVTLPYLLNVTPTNWNGYYESLVLVCTEFV